MDNDTEDDALVRQMLDMTESDLSILRAALNQKDVNLATLEGSANDLLWSQFKQRGWLSSISVFGLTEGQPTGALPSRAYSMLNQGREPILALLKKRDAAHSERVSLASRDKALSKFHDDRCQPLIAEWIAVVQAAGGKSFDVAALGSLFLISIVRAIAKKGEEEKVLDHISGMTRYLLSRDAGSSSGN